MSKTEIPILSDKQTKWLAAYLANGKNATRAAQSAGYKGNEKVLKVKGHENKLNWKIRYFLDKEQNIAKESIKADVMSRVERQAFWTKVIKDNLIDDNGAIQLNMADKLRASELLGRSEADFTDNLNSKNEEIIPNTEAENAALDAASREIKLKLA